MASLAGKTDNLLLLFLNPDYKMKHFKFGVENGGLNMYALPWIVIYTHRYKVLTMLRANSKLNHTLRFTTHVMRMRKVPIRHTTEVAKETESIRN